MSNKIKIKIKYMKLSSLLFVVFLLIKIPIRAVISEIPSIRNNVSWKLWKKNNKNKTKNKCNKYIG